jgi:hypothetical protein
MQRFQQPALDPLALVDALAAAPQRDDELLRRLAARLEPWRAEAVVEPIPGEGDDVVAPEPPAPALRLVHGYDERRYGPQQSLLDLLRRQDGERSALELIDLTARFPSTGHKKLPE